MPLVPLRSPLRLPVPTPPLAGSSSLPRSTPALFRALPRWAGWRAVAALCLVPLLVPQLAARPRARNLPPSGFQRGKTCYSHAGMAANCAYATAGDPWDHCAARRTSTAPSPATSPTAAPTASTAYPAYGKLYPGGAHRASLPCALLGHSRLRCTDAPPPRTGTSLGDTGCCRTATACCASLPRAAGSAAGTATIALRTLPPLTPLYNVAKAALAAVVSWEATKAGHRLPASPPPPPRSCPSPRAA